MVIVVDSEQAYAEIWSSEPDKDWTIKVPYEDLTDYVRKNCDLIDWFDPTPERPDPDNYVVSADYYIENLITKKELVEFILQYRW
jgi:hypothetical protein